MPGLHLHQSSRFWCFWLTMNACKTRRLEKSFFGQAFAVIFIASSPRKPLDESARVLDQLHQRPCLLGIFDCHQTFKLCANAIRISVRLYESEYTLNARTFVSNPSALRITIYFQITRSEALNVLGQEKAPGSRWLRTALPHITNRRSLPALQSSTMRLQLCSNSLASAPVRCRSTAQPPPLSPRPAPQANKTTATRPKGRKKAKKECMLPVGVEPTTSA